MNTTDLKTYLIYMIGNPVPIGMIDAYDETEARRWSAIELRRVGHVLLSLNDLTTQEL